jgi:hypothetical protein
LCSLIRSFVRAGAGRAQGAVCCADQAGREAARLHSDVRCPARCVLCVLLCCCGRCWLGGRRCGG